MIKSNPTTIDADTANTVIMVTNKNERELHFLTISPGKPNFPGGPSEPCKENIQLSLLSLLQNVPGCLALLAAPLRF